MNSKDMREKATKIAHEAREILGDGSTPLTAETEAQFDKAIAESDKLHARADAMEKLEAREKALEAIATDLPEQRSESRQKETSTEDTFEQYVRGNISEAEMRAQTVGTDTEGGYLVPEAWSNSIVESMKAYGPMLDGNLVDLLTTPTGAEINFPTNNDTANKGSLVAEATDVGDDELVFGNTKLGAYKYKSGVVLVSNELLRDNTYNLAGYVPRKIGERIGRIGNEHCTVGTGTNQPSGIVTGASVGKTTASATAIAAAEIIDLFYSLDPAYRSRAKFMANDTVKAAVRKLTDANGQFLWQPSMIAGEPETLLGMPFLSNNDMAGVATGNRSLIFGDFKCFMVRVVSGMGVKRLNERYAELDQTGFLTFARLDSAVLDAAGIKALVQA